MAIMGIISAIAAPRYLSSVGRAKLDAGARRVVADLSLARSLAQAASAPRTIAFNVVASTYEIQTYQFADRPGVAYVIDLKADPYSVQVQSASFGGSSSVTYSGYGVPTQAGTVVVKNWWGSKTITVSTLTSEVTIQ